MFIRNFDLVFTGLERQEWNNIKHEVCKSNRMNLVVFSLIAGLLLAILSLVCVFEPELRVNQRTYNIGCIVMFLMFWVSAVIAKDSDAIIEALIYVYSIVMFVIGMYISVFNSDVDSYAVTFMVLLFVLPLIYTGRPLFTAITIAVAMICYLSIIPYHVNPSYLFGEETNCLSFGALSIVVSAYLMRVKIRRFQLEYEVKESAITDGLTGLYNRREFDRQLSDVALRHETQKFYQHNVTIAVLDVNDLKSTNDNMGHIAGDEIIKSIASCIRKTFDNIGMCYRIGGDEFVVLMENEAIDENAMRQCLAENIKEGADALPIDINVACGFASTADYPDVNMSELFKIADDLMYQEKRNASASKSS